jgi:CubicO group peptidase (beta-lactamase class C family)
MAADVNGILVQGHFDPTFNQTIEQFAANFASGDDVGASFALSKDGEMVVDIWAGHLDSGLTQPWQENTLVNVWSSTKTVSFLCALVLADRGLLDFDEPVATYWPEFAQNGKEKVLVWHLMSHAAGLSGLDVPTTSEDMYDWDKITGLLAAQATWWEPGSASGYHAITQGYLIGEVVRRVTGKTLGTFLQDEIAGPLAADFHIGLPDDGFDRVSDLIIPPETSDNNLKINPDESSISYRSLTNPRAFAEACNTREWRKAEIPAANGQGNARSLTRLQTPLANGGSAFGVDLLSSDTAAMIMKERISGTDLVLMVPLTFGLGFALNRGPVPLTPNPNSCFWAGWGGSSVVIDQDAHIVSSYVMNKMFPSLLGDLRSFTLRNAAYKDLENL